MNGLLLEDPPALPEASCSLDHYLAQPDDSMDARIAAARERLGAEAVILGHHYQRDEVIRFADLSGDSYKLSKAAAESSAKYMIFCGVHFMAETADILAHPWQQVILPDLNAGCSMADMADIDQVEDAWEEMARVTDMSRVIPITYMNSSAALKAFVGRHDGAVCTSSNARAVLTWALEEGRGDKVLFFPDQHLGTPATSSGTVPTTCGSGTPGWLWAG